MFYLLHGQDIYRSKEKLNELIAHFKTKVSDLGFFRIEGENFSEAEFKELLKGKTLFEKKYKKPPKKFFYKLSFKKKKNILPDSPKSFELSNIKFNASLNSASLKF